MRTATAASTSSSPATGTRAKTGPAYDGSNGVGDRFFRNVPKGGHPFFVDETAASGLANTGWGFAASACDVDDDGDDDLYVANDFGVNALFENRSTRGHPFFVSVTKASGVEDEGYGMGCAWGDFDGDGRWDLHVADYWTPYRWILRDSRWPMPALPGALPRAADHGEDHVAADARATGSSATSAG